MAYPAVMVAALSGATVRQLSHWRRETATGAVLIPEVSSNRPIFYSFRDVVALRTCVFLRKDTSLQKIRTAIGNLRGLGEQKHLSTYTLVADAESIVLVENDRAVDLVKMPGQYVIAEMSDVLRPFLNRRQVEIPAFFRPRKNIAIDPGIRSGYPVIAGTRVPYDSVAGLIADGVSPKSVADFYPAVSADAAKDALEFARYVDSWRTKRSGTAS